MPDSSWDDETTSDTVAKALGSYIKGKVVLITGVTQNSLGADFARAISTYDPKLIILAGRDVKKAGLTSQDLVKYAPYMVTRILELDLGNQAQIREAAKVVNAYEENIDILMNNAAVMACPLGHTADGLELQFGTNHIGHFLFTNLIINKVLAAGKGARIINVSSNGHRLGGVRFEDPNFKNGDYNKWVAYGQAKTANILFSIGLAERLAKKGLYSYSLHPGAIITNLGRHLEEEDITMLQARIPKWKNLQQGSATHVVASFDQGILSDNGAYLADCQIAAVGEEAKGYATKETGNQDKLWALSEEIIGEKFEY